MLDLEEIQDEVNEAALHDAIQMLHASVELYKYVAPGRVEG